MSVDVTFINSQCFIGKKLKLDPPCPHLLCSTLQGASSYSLLIMDDATRMARASAATGPATDPASPTTTTKTKTASSATRRAARGTILVVLLRLVSFVGTQYCFRRLDASTVGRAHVQLDLVLSSILYLSREGFRLAVTRPIISSSSSATVSSTATPRETNGHGRTIGTVWLSGIVATVVSGVALLWHYWHHCDSAADGGDEDYCRAGMLYCGAACLEGWAEPVVLFFLQAPPHPSVAEKASAEGVAAVMKTAASVLVLSSFHLKPVTGLGVAQCMYAITYFIVLYAALWRHQRRQKQQQKQQQQQQLTINSSSSSIWPTSVRSMFHYETIRWTVLFTMQGMLKFLLQEGDRIVLNVMANSYNQGVYAMGSAYGGLVARLVLQPVEENARLLFGTLASSSSSTTNTTTASSTKAASLDPRLEASYTVLVKSVLYVGFLFSCVATNYTNIVLTVLAGRTWSQHVEAVHVLSAFCVYTAFLAANGLTEAFVYGVARTAHDVGRVSVAHTVTGLLFAASAPWAMRQYGTVGLVMANCVAMLGRTLFAVHFAAHYFAAPTHEGAAAAEQNGLPVRRRRRRRRLVQRMLPANVVLVAFGVAYLGTRASRDRMAQHIQAHGVEIGSRYWWRLSGEHVSVGVTVVVGILTVAYTAEREWRHQIRTLWHGKSE